MNLRPQALLAIVAFVVSVLFVLMPSSPHLMALFIFFAQPLFLIVAVMFLRRGLKELSASIVAIMWGVALAFAVAFPGPSGEWAAIGVFFAYIVNFPVGAITLALALVMRRGSPRLRRFCIITATTALLLPLLVHAIDRYNTRWKYKIVHRPEAVVFENLV